MDPKHPKRGILFYISDEIVSEGDVVAMRDVVAELTASRGWTLGPPVFLNESQEDPEAGGLRTVGGFFELYSASPPWGSALPVDVDRAHLDEVKATIDVLAAFSQSTNHEIAFELDGAQIGWIEKGVIDNSLREGLLEEWARTLNS